MSKINNLIFEKVFGSDVKYKDMHFSTDLNCAMLIVERTPKPFEWLIETQTEFGVKTYTAEVWGDTPASVGSWRGRSKSMAMAICKAALKKIVIEEIK